VVLEKEMSYPCSLSVDVWEIATSKGYINMNVPPLLPCHGPVHHAVGRRYYDAVKIESQTILVLFLVMHAC